MLIASNKMNNIEFGPAALRYFYKISYLIRYRFIVLPKFFITVFYIYVDVNNFEKALRDLKIVDQNDRERSSCLQ